MKDLAQKVMQKIREEHIIPASKFQTRWKGYAFWVMVGGAVLVGAAAILLIVFNFADVDVRFVQHLDAFVLARILFETAPYIWLALYGFAIALAIMAFRHTDRGYRIESFVLASSIMVLLFFFGIVGHMFRVERQLSGLITGYTPASLRSVVVPRENRWKRPGDGLLGGEVLLVRPEGFVLQSFDGKRWNIVVDEFVDNDGDIDDFMKNGTKVGVMGNVINENSVKAAAIKVFPDDWEGAKHTRPTGKMFIKESDE